MTTPVTYTGKDADITIGTKTHTNLGLGDYSLTLSRDTIEQELVGKIGNYFVAGSLSVEGSFTASELGKSALSEILSNILPTSQEGNSTPTIAMSGQAGTNSLGFYFASTQITGFDIDLGDADTISTASVDYTVLDPYNVDIIKATNDAGTWIGDIF